MSFRSLLFSPGNHARRMEKTRDADTDGVILDLEDAVAVAEKPAARATAARRAAILLKALISTAASAAAVLVLKIFFRACSAEQAGKRKRSAATAESI